MRRSRLRRLSAHEWMLVIAVLMGITLVALRWDYISSEVIDAVRAYFE